MTCVNPCAPPRSRAERKSGARDFLRVVAADDGSGRIERGLLRAGAGDLGQRVGEEDFPTLAQVAEVAFTLAGFQDAGARAFSPARSASA